MSIHFDYVIVCRVSYSSPLEYVAGFNCLTDAVDYFNQLQKQYKVKHSISTTKFVSIDEVIVELRRNLKAN